MLGRIVTLLAQFPFEGLRLRNWRANKPTTFGSTLWVDSTYNGKADTLTCQVYDRGCVKPNIVVIDANNSRWDYLHPTRKPVFGQTVDVSGCHATISIPSGYRLVRAVFTAHPLNGGQMRVQLLARDFFGKEATCELTLRTRLISDPDPDFTV
ncbi:MAG: hypothetical protein GC134_03525 [Proteobacteria bacterium]|nr:hypothetical protein [Pseudomonadota bacterium]